MPSVTLSRFDGIYPRRSDYELPDNAAQVADNVKLYAGELRAWQKPVLYSPQPVLPASAQAIYRLERPTDGAFVWLAWTADVDVVASPISDTVDGRIYYTGEATPRKTTYARATSGAAPYPFDYYEMGVVAPTSAPTGSSSGGTGGTETRVYLYTYISTFGAVKEESAPSPTLTVTGQINGATVALAGMGTTPPAGKYNITHKRIYRAVSGATTLDYRLVAEIPITQATYNDTLNASQLPGDPLISLFFTPPPADLKGLVAMPGNFLAGFRENEIWFSEPNYPHAWPVGYVLSARHEIVGLGVVGGLLVVCTVRQPEVVYGQSPDALGQEVIPLIEPCASKRSIATDAEAVLYASPNGLVAIGPGIRKRITDNIFRRDEFQAYTPSSIYARMYDGTYFGWFDSVAEGQGALLINSGDTPVLSTLSDERFTRAAFIDTRTAALYYVDPADNQLYEFDADDTNNDLYIWRSKKISLPHPLNVAVIQVYADYDFIADAPVDAAADIAFNTNLIATGTVEGAINENYINEFPINGSALVVPATDADLRYLQVLVYGDGELVAAQGFNSEFHHKLPSGRRYRTLEVEIVGNVPVYSVTLATAVRELKAS